MNYKQLLLTISLSLVPQALLQGAGLKNIFKDHTNAAYSDRRQRAIVASKTGCALTLKSVSACGMLGYYLYTFRGSLLQHKAFKELFPRKHIFGASAALATFTFAQVWERRLGRWLTRLDNRARRERQNAAAHAQEQERKKRAAQPKDCIICLERLPGNDFPVLTCGHSECCKACMLSTFGPALGERKLFKVNCQTFGCRQPVNAADVNRIMPPEKRAQYADLIEQEAWRTDNRAAKCPTVGCNRRFRTTRDRQLFTCPYCQDTCCTACAKKHPAGVRACADAAQAEADRAAEIARRKTDAQIAAEEADKKTINASTQPCPDCGAAIEKDGGCKFVDCKSKNCNYAFCWQCRKGPFHKHDAHTCINEEGQPYWSTDAFN